MMTGEEFKALRKSAKMTQGAMAEAIGLSQGFIGEMERGEKVVELRTELAARYVIERATVSIPASGAQR